jgi:AcrR family transcriptional regulator
MPDDALQQKRTAITRNHLLAAAFDLLVDHPEQPFSHEAVAKAAGIGDRTVYRYFPAQADLFEALWLQVREQSGTVFPTAESEIIPQLTVLYRAFDRNEKLIRATLQSPAGARIRAQGTEEGRSGFDNSLQELTRDLTPAKRRQVRAVFQGIHSAPFWQMLRDRGGLSGYEAAAAAAWAAQSLLETLRRTRKSSHTTIKTKQRGRSK